MNWLKEELAYAKKMKDAGKLNWVIIMTHTNMFTTGDHFKDLNAQGLHNPGSYLDVMEDSKVVDLVLDAHDHDYERTKSILGYRWFKDKDGKTYYKKTAKAYADPDSGAFGETKQGNGIVHMVVGIAGAAQRDLLDKKKVRRSFPGWPCVNRSPDRGETIKTESGIWFCNVDRHQQRVKGRGLMRRACSRPKTGLLKDADDDIIEGLLDRILVKK